MLQPVSPLDEIMATAGSRSNSVFAMYYHKPIISGGIFVNVVLGHAHRTLEKLAFKTELEVT